MINRTTSISFPNGENMRYFFLKVLNLDIEEIKEDTLFFDPLGIEVSLKEKLTLERNKIKVTSIKKDKVRIKEDIGDILKEREFDNEGFYISVYTYSIYIKSYNNDNHLQYVKRFYNKCKTWNNEVKHSCDSEITSDTCI